MLGGAVLLACLLWAFAAWLQRRGRSARARSRGARAVWGEARAVELLADAGYAVVDAQVRRRWLLSVDGQDFPVDLRADYLAEKDGALFVAEVKTGGAAPQLSTAATRRQLLEYRVAFDVDGVLLVDAEAGRVRRVVFPGVATPEAAPSPSYRSWLAAMGLAAAAAWIWWWTR
jgi:hypothetical protein